MSTPRIRTLKPEGWHDEAVCAVSRDARLLRIVLITYADDDGRWRHQPAAIIGFGFPEDDDVTPAKLKKWTAELIDSGMVITYTVDGKEYGTFPKWHAHQYIQKYRASELPDSGDDRIIPRRSKDGTETITGRSQSGSSPVAVPDESDSENNPPRASGSGLGSGSGSVVDLKDARANDAGTRLAETVEILETAPRLTFDPDHVAVANVLAMYPPPADHRKAAHLTVSRVTDPSYRTTAAARALQYAFADLAKQQPAEKPKPAFSRGDMSVYDRGVA